MLLLLLHLCPLPRHSMPHTSFIHRHLGWRALSVGGAPLPPAPALPRLCGEGGTGQEGAAM